MKLALVGFGGVSKAFTNLLEDKITLLKQEHLEIQVLYIFNSSGCLYMPHGIPLTDLNKHIRDGGSLSNYPLNHSHDMNYDKMLKNKDIDMVVELTSTNKDTGEPGLTHIKKALDHGLHVVTGNKGPIQISYHELKTLAFKNGVQLGIGCTVGGALPSMNAGIIDLAGSDIQIIEGVLNGTSNHILKQMEEHGFSYQEALAQAQSAGIAESDPRLDVEGWDTASKLLILTNVLCNQHQTLDDVIVEGITGLNHEDIQMAKLENKKYKLIGRATQTTHDFILHVKAEKVDASHPFYNVEGKNKAVRYETDTLGELTVIGGASGVRPAAASILRDIINIHRGYRYIK